MRKSRRGMCPPLLAIGLAFILITVTSCMAVAKAADSTIPGSEVAPPGGTTTTTADNDTGYGDPPEGAEVEPPAEDGTQVQPDETSVTDPTQDPNYLLWLQQQQQQEGDPYTGDGTDDDPLVDPDPEPEVTPDPVGSYPSPLDTSGVNIVSPSIADLTAKDADLEALLYPSGLRLPTKYMDLLMFAPVSYSSPITSEAGYLLKTIAPVDNSTYTYAEYRAAELYLAMCRLYKAADTETTLATAASVKSLDTNTTVNWMMNVTNATLSDQKRMVALISNYQSILETLASGSSITSHKQYTDITAQHKGVRYSCGNLDDLVALSQGSTVRDADLSSYVLGLYSWWDYVGVTHTFTSSIAEYSTYYDEFSFNGVNFTKGAPVANIHGGMGSGSGGGIAAGEQGAEQGQSVVDVEIGGLEGTLGNSNPIVSGSSTQGGISSSSASNPSDTPVSAVGNKPGPDTGILPDGSRGLKEAGSIAAVVFVVIAVIALWIIHLSRKGGRFF